MRKYLFWIYFSVHHIIWGTALIIRSGQDIPTSFKELFITHHYGSLYFFLVIAMFIVFEAFIIASFFVDELAAWRKGITFVFFLTSSVLTELYYIPFMF